MVPGLSENNGSGALYEVSPDVSMTASWPLGQVQQFYAEMTRRLSAVMTLLDTIPIGEMQLVNERLRSTGVLSLPAEISADQARAWMNNLQRDKILFELLLEVITHLKSP
jgi:hypothetical protein